MIILYDVSIKKPLLKLQHDTKIDAASDASARLCNETKSKMNKKKIFMKVRASFYLFCRDKVVNFY